MARLYEDPDLDPWRASGLGHPYVFTGRREVRNFLVANACRLDEYHIDALRVDAVSSMLYLDYSRNKPGQWHPNIYGGRENPRPSTSSREATATAYKNNPGIMMIAEESTAYPGITAPDRCRRFGLRPQVEHGLDARHPASARGADQP